MTCREKLAMEYPKDVREKWLGGCYGCPHRHGYAKRPEECGVRFEPSYELCTRCWDREVEEQNECKVREGEKEMIVEELVNLLDKGSKFEVRETYDEKCIFSSDDWYGKRGYYHKPFEEIKERIVQQISNFNANEFTVYVKVEASVEEQSN